MNLVTVQNVGCSNAYLCEKFVDMKKVALQRRVSRSLAITISTISSFSFAVRLHNDVCRRLPTWSIVCTHQCCHRNSSGCHQLLVPLPSTWRRPSGGHWSVVRCFGSSHQGFSSGERVCAGFYLRVYSQARLQDGLLIRKSRFCLERDIEWLRQ